MDMTAVWFLVTSAALATLSRDAFLPVFLSLPLAFVALACAALDGQGVEPGLAGMAHRAGALFLAGQLGFLLGCGFSIARGAVGRASTDRTSPRDALSRSR